MNFIHDDGNGVLTNDKGEEVDDEQYLLTLKTNLKSYLDLKPPEKPSKVHKVKEKIPEKVLEENNNRTYRNYKKEDMDKFYFLVLEQNRLIQSAPKELFIPPGTEELDMRKPGSE